MSILLLAFHSFGLVSGHARLLEPPSRSSMWRAGFQNPPDFDDNQGYCGGLTHMHGQGGKCGICGDPWDASPRQHEVGGRFANGIIARVYRPGDDVDVVVEVTANHFGYFTFAMCANNDTSSDPEQDCFDNLTLLVLPDLKDRFPLKSKDTGTFKLKLRLPADVWCKQCILQWTWTGGNNWGICPDGKGRLGCGPQEVFRACSDIAIEGTPVNRSLTDSAKVTTTDPVFWRDSQDHNIGEISNGIERSTEKTMKVPHRIYHHHGPMETLNGHYALKCIAIGSYRKVPGMGDWCNINCSHDPPHCPQSHCYCS